MKTLNITFEDSEFNYMFAMKKKTESWRAFIFRSVKDSNFLNEDIIFTKDKG